jgi:hypothetical protein
MKSETIATLALLLGSMAGLIAAPEVVPAPTYAADRPRWDKQDLIVSSLTTLVSAQRNGRVREIWSGMDDIKRRTPIFVEFSGVGQIEKNGTWLDLTTLRYSDAGSRPGLIHLQSEDGAVTCEISSRKAAPQSPIFIKYSFKEAVNFRYDIQWKHPEKVRLEHSDETNGMSEFAVTWGCWRFVRFQPDGSYGPALKVATWPSGKSIPGDAGHFIREISSAREIVVCMDATGRQMPGYGNFVEAWKSLLGGYRDSDQERNADRLQITTGKQLIDALFSDSIDAVEALQFSNGVIEADPFNYRDAWVRDGGYTVMGLALTGNFEEGDAFFDFWAAQPGFGWVGGEKEAQQGEIGVLALWYYSRLRPDGDAFLKKHWDYVQKVSSYMQKRVEKEGMLDLADEWICSSPRKATWPNAEVYAGLIASAKIADRLEYTDQATGWRKAAERLKEQFEATAYDTTLQRFIPFAPGKTKDGEESVVDTRVDSGMFNLVRLEIFGKGQGIVAAGDARFISTQTAIGNVLETKEHLIGRFDALPGSPSFPKGQANDNWPIGSSWAAQTAWLQGKPDLGWSYLNSLAEKRALCLQNSSYLPEFWRNDGRPNIPILAWSHGEYLTAMVLLTLGVNLEPANADLGLAPSLPPGSNHATVKNFRFHNWRLDFELTRQGKQIMVKLMSHHQGTKDQTLRVALPDHSTLTLKPDVETSLSVVARN